MAASRPSLAMVASALVSLTLTACGNGPRLGEGNEPMVVTKMTDLPAPDSADQSGATQTYRVGPLDKLAIIVAGVPELSETFRTDMQGRFQLPYVGEINASGLSLAEVTAIIEQRLGAGYIVDPHVSVNLDDSTNLVYTVGGQVNEAGIFPIDGNMTLLRAIASAKGLTEFARVDDVVVFRTVSGERMAALYNLGAIHRGVYADPRIYAGDLVEVGDSVARRRMQQFIQVLPLLTTPIIVALQRPR